MAPGQRVPCHYNIPAFPNAGGGWAVMIDWLPPNLLTLGVTMNDVTLKAAGLAIAVAAVTAVVGATTEPWWWCNMFTCPPEPQSGALVPPDTPPDTPPEPEDEPEYRTIAAVPEHMSGLLMETNLQGKDINNGLRVANVQQCVKLCAETEQCVAMTYVFPNTEDRENGACWLKGDAPAESANPYMISARKIPATPERRELVSRS